MAAARTCMHRSPISLGSLALAACLSTPSSEGGRDAQGPNGAVTSGHELASTAGLEVLRDGGNAMDAGITMAAVLSVARPHMNGLGGDMFLLYYEAASRELHALNASGWAGARATVETVRTALGDTAGMPETGAMTVTVPGAVRGWAAALERFGTISWGEALEPAVRLARVGLPVSERLAADIAGQVGKLRRTEEAARIYLPAGRPPRPGTLLRHHDLAATLARLQQNGPDELYTGRTARRILRTLDAEGGFLRIQDLVAYRPVWTDPVTLRYRGLTVGTAPPNSQGVMLLEILHLMERFDLQAMGHNTPDYLHTLAETIRLAARDRDTSIADPAAMRTSVAQLLDSARLAALSRSIDPAGRAPAASMAARPDQPNTVYVIAVDERGNVVSLIQSLFHSFGSGIVARETGIVLHNRGALFTLDASHPNVLAPRKRPYHTLTPTMVLRDGRPWLVMGTPGGDGQTHTLTQILHNVLLFGMTPQEAIDAPRLRVYRGARLAIEDRVPADVRAALEARGYLVLPRSGWTAEFGGAQAVLIDFASGAKRAGADRRREGYAIAY